MPLERTSLLPCSVAELADDAGYSALIKVWDHKIRSADVSGTTRHTDEVEIRAGC